MAVLADFLSLPAVAVLLLTIGLTGLILEMMSPGFGAPGAVGIGAFVLFFAGRWMAGDMDFSPPVLFAAGLLLLILELFLPTFGILGVAGFLLLTSGIVFAAPDVKTGLASLGIAIVATALLVWMFVKVFGWKWSWNRLILTDRQSDEQGYRSNRDRRHLLGKTGTTLTVLRPSGFAEIDGNREDVVSEGGAIPAGTRVRVIHVEGHRVVVRPVENGENDTR
ncbi:NfeD family protein [Staphylospora marina]|uniref:NfeD family protein n=1 Tax=Staphylospora marina TaxID=2490858 RepID=UPI000F5BAACA|nr:NfeD family protein [Staphylospora marina]